MTVPTICEHCHPRIRLISMEVSKEVSVMLSSQQEWAQRTWGFLSYAVDQRRPECQQVCSASPTWCPGSSFPRALQPYSLPAASLQPTSRQPPYNFQKASVLFWVSTLLSPSLPQSHPAPALGVASLSPLPPAPGVTRVSRGPGGYTMEQRSSSAWPRPWCLLRFKHTPESCIWGCST